MADAGSPTGASSTARGALSDQELREAFGADLGAGPESSAPAAVAPSAHASAQGEPTTSEPIAREGQPSWREFAEGWQIGLYRDPVLCGTFAGLVLGVLGVFVVLRRAVFVTAAVTQAAGLGVALAFLAQIALGLAVPPVVGALVLALTATAVLAYRAGRLRLPQETLVGLIYLVASAAALLVGDRITQESHDVAGILFGTAVLVRPEDLLLVELGGALTLVITLVSYRGLLFAGFDPEGARVHGLPVRLLDLLLWVLVALEVSVTTRAIGALPVFAFAVLPAMAALSLADRVRRALLLAAVLGGAAGALGYLFAFFLEFPVGASQATVATLFLLICLPIARWRRPSAA